MWGSPPVMMLELVFWSSVALVLYAYLGYPCALMALSLVRHRPVRKGTATPDVSFIITAHNEASRIAEKIENTIGQNYPARKSRDHCRVGLFDRRDRRDR